MGSISVGDLDLFFVGHALINSPGFTSGCLVSGWGTKNKSRVALMRKLLIRFVCTACNNGNVFLFDSMPVSSK